TINGVINAIKDEIRYVEPDDPPEVKPFKEQKSNSQGVSVKGVDNLMIRFGHCCNPLPGDDIIGYITKGKGITVHRRDCNSLRHGADSARCIEVSWEGGSESRFQAEIEVYAQDRDRLTTDIMNAIADTKSTINSVYGRSGKHGMAHVNVKIEVKSNEHLEFIINKLRKIRDVNRVRRVIHGKPQEEKL
ncbi:MAG: (p)ppGpp synthetase, partial [Bacillota bacterium]|nr:(p)ppGpp synthetase [Bacillota bacterium]